MIGYCYLITCDDGKPLLMFYFSGFMQDAALSKQYEDFLSRSDLTLAQVLLHDSTISEVKRNPRLVEKLRPMLEELIDYVVKEPETDAGDLAARKLPFIACEVLSTEEILACFSQRTELIPRFFDLLNSAPPLNLTLAGYCSQVTQHIIQRHYKAVLTFLSQDESLGRNLLKHLQTRAVADVYLMLIMKDPECSEETVHGRLSLFKSLLLFIDRNRSTAELGNIDYIVTEVLRRQSEITGWGLIVSTVLSPDVMENFYQVLSEADSPAVELCANVLSELITHSDFETLVEALEITLTTIHQPSEGTGVVVNPTDYPAMVIDHLDKIVGKAIVSLQTCTGGIPIPTAFGQSVNPIGPVRLALIRFINSTFKLDSGATFLVICDSGYLEYITDLFVTSHWNSTLHHAYEQLVRSIIDGQSPSLKEALFDRVNLLKVLKDIADSPCCVGPTGSKLRKGSMGHVTNIGNALLKVSTVDATVSARLKSDTWDQFQRQYLTERNKVQTAVPLSHSESQVSVENLPLEDDPEDGEMEFAVMSSQDVETLQDNSNPSLVSSDPDIEIQQGSDVYNDLLFWQMPMSTEELPDLD